MRVTTGKRKATIGQRLDLEAVSAESHGDEGPRFGGGLGLDSVEALELVLPNESGYGIETQDAEVGEEALASARVLSGRINARLAAAPAPLAAPAPREQIA